MHKGIQLHSHRAKCNVYATLLFTCFHFLTSFWKGRIASRFGGCHMQGKCLNPCSISLAFDTFKNQSLTSRYSSMVGMKLLCRYEAVNSFPGTSHVTHVIPGHNEVCDLWCAKTRSVSTIIKCMAPGQYNNRGKGKGITNIKTTPNFKVTRF